MQKSINNRRGLIIVGKVKILGRRKKECQGEESGKQRMAGSEQKKVGCRESSKSWAPKLASAKAGDGGSEVTNATDHVR